MIEPTRKSDIIENDVLKAFIQELKETEKRLLKYDEALSKTAKTMKNEFESANTKTIQGMQKISRLRQQAEKEVKKKRANQKSLHVVQKEMLKLDKQVKTAEAQKIAAYSQENKQLQKLRHEKNQINKATRDEIKQAERSKNAYLKLSDSSKRYKDESKRLGAELLALEKAGQRNSRRWNELEKEYKDVTRQAQLTDSQLKQLDKTVGDNQRNVGNYESATAKLTSGLKMLAGAAGLGALVGGLGSVTKELSRAENQARLFFNTSKEGSKDIAQEAMILAKVYDKDVNEVLRSANVLSKQFKIDGTAALALVNQGFEKGGDVSGELLENISEYSTQLRLAGLNAEQSISIITQSQQQGVFSDKGIDAIKEATLSLREMTPPAQEALEAIGMSAEQVQKDIASGTRTYFDVIQEISSKTNEVGEESQAAGMILADVFKGAGEDAGDFIFSLGKMNTSLEDLEDQNQGLKGAIQNLTKEFYELVFGVEDALDVNNRFAGIINFVANNLGTIIGVIGRVIGYWAIYRVQLMAVRSVKSGLLKTISNTIASLPKLISGLRGASFSFRGLGNAIKSIPFVAIIASIVELVTWLWNSEEAANANTEAEKKLNDEMERGAEIRADRVNSQREINELVDQRNKLSQAQLKSLRDEIQGEIALAEAADRNLKLAKDRISEAQTTQDINQQKINQLREQLNLTRGNTIAEQQEREAIQFKIDLLIAENTEVEERQKLAKDGIELTDDEIKNLALRKEQLALILPLIKSDVRVKKDDNKETDKAKEAQERYNKALESSLRIRQLINDIESAEVGGALSDAGRATEEAIQAERDAIINGNYSILLSYEERINALNDVIDTETELRRLNAENAFEFERTTLEAERDRLESKKKLSQEDLNRIKEINLQIELLEIEHQQEMNDINREGEEKKLETKKEIDGLLLEADKEQKAKEKEEAERLKKLREEQQKEALKMINDTQKAITAALANQIDERIALTELEAQAAREQQDYLRTLAENGTIEAQQSITEERERELAALREKERLEKQKATLQLISSGLEVFSTELENGADPASALATTVTTTGALTEFLSGLNFFAKGTDNAPEGAAVVGEEGREAVFSKSGKLKGIFGQKGAELTNLKAGDIVKTNPETERWMRDSAMVNDVAPMKKDTAGNSYDLLGKKLDSVEKAIKNIPTNDWSVEDAAKNVMNLIKTTKKGGDKRVSKYRVKY